MSELWQTIAAVLLSALIAGLAYGGEYLDPSMTTPKAMNEMFDKLAKETCAGPLPYKWVAGDFLTQRSLDLNTEHIIKAIRKGGCKAKVKK